MDSAGSASPIRVLLIEDSARDAAHIEYLLASPSYQLDKSASLREVDFEKKYDVVLLDLNLPDCSGVDALEEVTQKLQIPIIIVTGSCNPEDGYQAARRGAYSFVEKDLLSSRLLRREIDFVLVRARLEEAKSRIVDNLQKKSEYKSNFLAQFSHEIRTPLNAVVGMASLLDSTTLTEEQSQFLRGLKIGAERLLTIVNDVLDISKVEAGKLDLDISEFNIRELIRDCLIMYSHDAREKQLFLADFVDPKVPTLIRSDPSRIKQILLNYLSNAIKYTPSGHIVVECSLIADDQLNFSVKDSGRGLSKAQQERIFAPFMQAEAKDSSRGTGLGLVICQKLANLMDGQVGIESTQGQGSNFWFTVTPQKMTTSKSVRAPLSELTVAISGDQGFESEFLRRQLAARGIAVQNAATATAADVLLVDSRDQQGQEETKAHLEKFSNRVLFLGAPLGLKIPGGKKLEAPYCHAAILAAIEQVTGPASRDSTSKLDQKDSTDNFSIAPWHILVVDDDQLNREILGAMLQKLGLEPKFASDGAEAVACSEREDFDIIFMDCSMPEMDGYTATSIIKKRGRSPMIVALTAHAFQDDERRCHAAGMDEVMTKPVKMADIAGFLHNIPIGASKPS